MQIATGGERRAGPRRLHHSHAYRVLSREPAAAAID
jgi:hypothetical protein